jgi:kinesin family protein 2/24
LGHIAGLEHRIARDLFNTAQDVGQRLLQAERAGGGGMMDACDASDIFELSVTFLELLGKHAADLADPATATEVDKHGNVIQKEVPICEDKVRFLFNRRDAQR